MTTRRRFIRACATGHGEFVMRTPGSLLVVELMRQGRSARARWVISH